jgi:hypothetical protein
MRRWIKTGEVRIIWEDHSEPVSDDVEPQDGAYLFQSVGFIKKEDAKQVQLCRDIDEHGNLFRCITILKKNITHRKVLK